MEGVITERTTGQVARSDRHPNSHTSAQPKPASQTVSVEYAAAELGVGRTTLYQAIKRGEVPVLRIGRRCVIRRATLARLLAEEAHRTAQGANQHNAA